MSPETCASTVEAVDDRVGKGVETVASVEYAIQKKRRRTTQVQQPKNLKNVHDVVRQRAEYED